MYDIKEYRKKYYQSHKERKHELAVKWRATHQEWMKNYRETHKEEKKELLKKLRQTLRDRILNLLGDKCASCGTIDKRVLQIDHINGGGTRERKQKFRDYTRYYRHVLTNMWNYQILCANCNLIKKIEKNEVCKGNHKVVTLQ